MCVYCIYPLTLLLYSKLGFTGVYKFFVLLLQNIDSGYALEAPLTCTHKQCFEQKQEKCQQNSYEIFNFYS